MALKPTPHDDDPVAAAEEELSASPVGSPPEELMAEAAAITGQLDPTDKPAALDVEGVRYVYIPDIDEYATEEGELLDRKSQPAVRALFAWRRHREQLRAMEEAQAEREAAGPDDVHIHNTEKPVDFGEFETGRRWVGIKDLTPGIHGSEGVKVGHGVVVRYLPETDEAGRKLTERQRRGEARMQHFRVVHIDEGTSIVSLEPGERLRPNAVVTYPKPYVFDWLQLIAAIEQTTVERYVNKLVHQEYARSDIRTAQAVGSGMAGKVGANPELEHERRVGR